MATQQEPEPQAERRPDEPGAAQPEPEREGTPAAEANQDASAAETALAQAATELAAAEDRWRRAMADLDNLRKRYARELAREREAERERVAAAFLPVLDNLERALEHAGSDAAYDQDALVRGLRSVREQALGVLAALGYPRQDKAGVPFDPARHEAVSVEEETEAAPGTVVRVLHPGYGEGERQLRPAAVAVAAGKRE
ncbi:MAG TPA: nucleotide exchange factor GrpE [Actinomycetes bacterium]